MGASTAARGVLVYRWVSLAWMAAVVVTYPDSFARGWLAWGGLVVAAAWTAAATVRPASGPLLAVDVVVAGAVVLASGLVVAPGDVGAGRPFYATAWPLAAALSWGLSFGPRGGVAAGLLLGGAVVATRPLNGVALASLSRGQLQALLNGGVGYLVAGWAAGVVANLLREAGREAERATAALVVEREKAARGGERERLARQIHDSVLQALALLHKRLAAGPPTQAESTELAELSATNETALRRLILRAPEDGPPGRASLRDALEDVASGTGATVTATGPIWMSRPAVDEVAAAVRQALANVAEHAAATQTTVFVEESNGHVVVSVRDDGVGFTFDPDALRASDKAGVLKSIVGRIEDLGGTVRILSSPGRGTEIEMTLPSGPVS